MKLTFNPILLFIICFPLGLAAQSTIKGSVVDALTGETLIGATVVEGLSTNGTAADIDGNFTLEGVNLPATLEVSYTGYKSQEILVETDDFLAITLELSSETLDEVLVVGYGKQEKRVSTGAISKISAKDLEGIVSSDVGAALESQVTGLLINESSGQPGSSKVILIRGVSTNGDNSPLFIVDGLTVGNIDNINPGDVESVDVLKDAASCAIYGARAANGVVIITTKKGKNKVGGEITYEGNLVNSRPWRVPEMMSSEEYVMITREKFENGGQSSALESLGFPNVGDPLENNTRWMDEIFAPANVVNHRLSANIKNAFISLDYWNQNGVIGGDKSNYKRYSARFNSKKEINKYITIGENVYLNRVDNQNIGVNNAFGSVLVDAFAYDPLTGIYNPEKDYGFEQSKWVQKEYINPLSRLFLSNGSGIGDQLQGGVYLEIMPIDGLKLHFGGGIETGSYNFRGFNPDYAFHDAFVNINNDVNIGFGQYQSSQLENYLNYNKTFKDFHNFDFVLGNTFVEATSVFGGGSTSDIPDAVKFDPNWQIINAGQDSTDLAYGGISVPYRLISYFSRVQYDYDKKYLMTATIRRDGSSNFGLNNRWGIFPSFSLGWVISKESFFNYDPISYLKVRGSWGINGSDRIAPLSYAATIENVFTYAFGQDQSLNTGAALATPPNPNVKWEESDQIDIGVELELLEGKWTIDADIYRKTTRDLLMNEVIPGYIGATNNPISNLGEIRNQGVELGISNRVRKNDFTLTTTLNYTKFTNEVTNVAGDLGYIDGWSWPVRNTPITRMTEGYPVGHFVGYQTAGIFQSQAEVFGHINAEGDLLQPDAVPGDLIFLDTNGDGIINTDDIGHIGSPWPDHIFGLTFNVKYKNFDVSAVLSAQIGHDIFRSYERSDITYTNYQTFWLDRWTPENPSDEYFRLTSSDRNNNQRPSDFYLEDGTFYRLKNLQLGYNVPTKLLEKIKMKEMRLYFTTNNLVTITDYQGFDPDIGTNNWILDTGIDKGAYPSNKSVGGGVKVTF